MKVKLFVTKICLLLLFILPGAEWGVAGVKPLALYKNTIWTSANGLPQNCVHAITQGPDGYIWFGTDAGLARFDGIKFTSYDRYNTPLLINDIIQGFCMDRQDTLWIATRHGGVARFQNGKFEKGLTTDDGLCSNNVNCIIESGTDSLWIGTISGLNRLENGKIRKIPLPDGSNSNYVLSLNESPDGYLWVGTQDGLLKLGKRNNRYEVLLSLFRGYKISSLARDKKGNLWIATYENGAIYLNNGEPIFYTTQNGLKSNFLDNIAIDMEGSIWLASRDSGVMRIKEGVIDSFDIDNGLSMPFVLTIFPDNEGSMWIGTNGGGINHLFNSSIVSYTLRRGFDSEQNYGLFEDKDGNIWSGSFGFGVFCLKDGRIFKEITEANGLPLNIVVTTGQDKDGNMWFGTYGKGAACMKNDKIIVYDTRHGLIDNFVYSIFLDSKGVLWVGTDNGGLHRFVSNHFKLFEKYCGKMRIMMEDSKGVLWVGSSLCGLLRIKDNKIIEKIDETKGLIHPDVTCFLEDHRGNSWIGTYGGGVLVRKEGGFRTIKKTDGLPHDIIFSILEDDQNSLWMSSMNGIVCYPEKEVEDFLSGRHSHLKGILFDEADGMKNKECDGGSQAPGLKAKDGTLWFITTDGLVSIDPHNLRRNSIPPPVVIDKVLIGGKEYSPRSNITALPGKDSIEIYYAGLSYLIPERVLFKYKLEGYDEDWVFAGNRRNALYTNIPNGTYTFQVLACNNDKIWSKEAASVLITIVPMFWQTWWFVMSSLLALSGLVWFLIVIRERKIIKRQQELESLVEERTGILSNKTQLLEKQTDELERINSIVKAININVNYKDILKSILEEATVLEDVERSIAFVYNKAGGMYSIEAYWGYNSGSFSTLQMSFIEMEARYISGSKEIAPGIFIISSMAGRPYESKLMIAGISKSAVIIKIPMEDVPAGYLLFENMTEENVFDYTDFHLLIKLRDHIASAFIKSKLLLDLDNERKIASEANRSKSLFLARMSHEIRTPLNSVIGFSDMLLDTELNEEQKEFTQNINKCGEALLYLIDEILDFSKVEAGQLTFQVIDFDLEVMAFDVCHLMGPRLENKPIEILCRVDENLPPYILGDPGRIRQVLVNLMGNAVKFTHDGEIELSVKVEEETSNKLKIIVTVRDTGIGISSDQIENVFGLFQQGDGSITRKYGGTGLGLAISRQIARMMSGDIHVESVEGTGSTFIFTAWLDKSRKLDERKEFPPILEGKKILLVDDNPINLEIISHIIEYHHMIPISVSSSENVISLLEQELHKGEPIQLGILDIQMPGFSGYELAKQIRNSPHPEIKNLFLVAFTSSTEKQTQLFKEAGFDGFLPKPVQRQRLLMLLKRLFGENPGENETRRSKKELITRHSIVDEAKHSIHILLAEDNLLNQKLAGFMLTKAGYNLDIAQTGKEAVDLFLSNPARFDLIFMDINMPEMDGIQATRILREKGFAQIPIIAMTADALKEDQEKCLAAGMNDFISKPIKREVVFNMVRKWILKEAWTSGSRFV